jgi:hypothetical protein
MCLEASKLLHLQFLSLNFLQHLLLCIQPRQSEWQHRGLLGLQLQDGGLAADHKLLFVCGVYQWRLYGFGLCLQLAESFSTSSSTWEMIAESFPVSSIQLAGSVWMPV